MENRLPTKSLLRWTCSVWMVLVVLFCSLPDRVNAQTASSLNPHGDIQIACQDCHTSAAWKPVRENPDFDHNLQTEYALAGAHAVTPCRGCHLQNRLDSPKLDGDPCGLCHVDIHQGRFIETCDACHGMESFEEVSGDPLHNQTAFPLTGAHRDVVCQSCHFDDQFGGYTTLDTNCFSCHEGTFLQAPGHVERNFPLECEQCHTTFSWSDNLFNHALVSGGFSLVGAHQVISCGGCHNEAQNFEPIFFPADQNDCITCHQPTFDRAHAGSGFPTTCLTCHNQDTWFGAQFNHAVVAQGFGLVGAHETIACTSCHNADANFEPIFFPTDQNDCITCHQPTFDRAHAGSGFPTTCLTCHNQDTWFGATFNHAAVAQGFGLVGAHEVAACTSCHNADANFEPIFFPANQNDCIACHQQTFDRAHAGSGFPTTCLTCHNQDTWAGGQFNHAAVAQGFSLVGAHQAAPCTSCHDAGANFEPLFFPTNQNDCIACHQQSFDRAHSGSGFSTNCLDCHNTTSWN